jgi:small subunit ribosomal protein S17
VIKRSKKFYAHDEKQRAQVGDVVRIVETRPMSKLKRWRLDDVLRRPPLAHTAGEEQTAS